jgi:hypothetical protein
MHRYDVFVFNVYVKAAIQQRRQQSRAEQDPFSAEYVPFDVLVSAFPMAAHSSIKYGVEAWHAAWQHRRCPTPCEDLFHLSSKLISFSSTQHCMLVCVAEALLSTNHLRASSLVTNTFIQPNPEAKVARKSLLSGAELCVPTFHLTDNVCIFF